MCGFAPIHWRLYPARTVGSPPAQAPSLRGSKHDSYSEELLVDDQVIKEFQSKEPNLESIFRGWCWNFCLPPARLIQGRGLKDLEKVIFDLGGEPYYHNITKENKALMLYFAAHYGDQEVEVELSPGEWQTVFKTLGTNPEKQYRMATVLRYDFDWVDKNWSPHFPFDLPSLLVWRKENWSNADLHSKLTTILDEADPPLQVCQIDKSCVLTADVIVAAYYLKFHHPSQPWRRISIEEIRSHALDQQWLYNFVIRKNGNKARPFMEQLLGGNYEIIEGENADDIFNFAGLYGPGIIGSFQTEDDFHVRDKVLFSGTASFPHENSNVVHAMVLVGVRVDVDGTFWLLVQNSWRHKQFVTMTYEYFQSCGGRVWFIAGDGELAKVFNQD
jgi:hypothetical protein